MNLSFDLDEIRVQLEELGLTNVNTEQLNCLKQDLDDLINKDSAQTNRSTISNSVNSTISNQPYKSCINHKSDKLYFDNRQDDKGEDNFDGEAGEKSARALSLVLNEIKKTSPDRVHECHYFSVPHKTQFVSTSKKVMHNYPPTGSHSHCPTKVDTLKRLDDSVMGDIESSLNASTVNANLHEITSDKLSTQSLKDKLCSRHNTMLNYLINDNDQYDSSFCSTSSPSVSNRKSNQPPKSDIAIKNSQPRSCNTQICKHGKLIRTVDTDTNSIRANTATTTNMIDMGGGYQSEKAHYSNAGTSSHNDRTPRCRSVYGVKSPRSARFPDDPIAQQHHYIQLTNASDYRLQSHQPKSQRLCRQDPVSKYHTYRRGWLIHLPPGEDARRALRWNIKTAMMHHEVPLLQRNCAELVNLLGPDVVASVERDRQRHLKNLQLDYVPPTSKRYNSLRWKLRSQLNGAASQSLYARY